MLTYCWLFHIYNVSLTPYWETALELVTTFNYLESWSPNACPTVVDTMKNIKHYVQGQ